MVEAIFELRMLVVSVVAGFVVIFEAGVEEGSEVAREVFEGGLKLQASSGN